MTRQHSQALHIDTVRPSRLEDVSGHCTSSNDITTNAFGAVECAGVLCQADQAMLACGVCGACGEVSV